jgi:hypothetical protein
MASTEQSSSCPAGQTGVRVVDLDVQETSTSSLVSQKSVRQAYDHVNAEWVNVADVWDRMIQRLDDECLALSDCDCIGGCTAVICTSGCGRCPYGFHPKMADSLGGAMFTDGAIKFLLYMVEKFRAALGELIERKES